MFHRRKAIEFNPIDPLGDGLREMIEAEQGRPEAIDLHEQLSALALESYWRSVNSANDDEPSNMSLFDLAEGE
ncbi:MAG: hypothetical protein L0H38_02490 [bacterium]|nr:hypothetical protein [bacterium]